MWERLVAAMIEPAEHPDPAWPGIYRCCAIKRLISNTITTHFNLPQSSPWSGNAASFLPAPYLRISFLNTSPTPLSISYERWAMSRRFTPFSSPPQACRSIGPPYRTTTGPPSEFILIFPLFSVNLHYVFRGYHPVYIHAFLILFRLISFFRAILRFNQQTFHVTIKSAFIL